MPVINKHKEFQELEPIFLRMRDCYNGEDAVKAGGEKYLPRLAEDTDADYKNYKMRANFFPALARTIDGLVGGVFRVDPVVEFPDEKIKGDVTLTGIDIKQFSKMITTEVCLQAKVGILVDYDEEARRPFLISYPAESILNWSEDFVVVVEDIDEADPADEFNIKTVKRYRQIIRRPGGAEVRTFKTALDGTVDTAFTSTFIKSPGEDSDFPFILCKPVGDAWTKANPPLLGLANVNLSCFRNSADLENGRHLTALPTPWIADDEIRQDLKADPSMKIKLGSKAAFILSSRGRAGFLEYTGQGLGALERAIEEKKSEMAALGAMMILQQRKQVESSETARIHSSSQTSILANIVTGAEHGIKKALDIMVKLMNRTAEVKFELNRDFVETTLDPTQLTALVQTWQAGGITHEVLAWNLKKSSMLPPDMSVEDLVAEATKQFEEKQKKAAEQAMEIMQKKAETQPPNGGGGAPGGVKTDAPGSEDNADRRKMDKNTVGPKPTITK